MLRYPSGKYGGIMLKINNLTKKFGSNIAVNSVSIDVEKPIMLGIIGASGAGKSTLLRMINRLESQTSGSISFDGLSVSDLNGAAKAKWQSNCAMIFQQFNLIDRLDVLTNVLSGTLGINFKLLKLLDKLCQNF